MKLNIDGRTAYATYTSGSGSSSLTFTYTTQAGDADFDGIAVVSPLELNGGTIADVPGNALSPLSFTIPVTSGIKIDYPSLSLDLINNDYLLNGSRYTSLPSFLTAAGASYTRSGAATYFDSSGIMQTAGTNVPRQNYDPVTLAAKGLLIEDARTNSLRNSIMAGANVGTFANNSGPGGAAGSLPTNWTSRGSLVSGLTAYIAAKGTEFGMQYIDMRVAGTASGGSDFGVYFEGSSQIPAAAGDYWSGSVYARLINATSGYTGSNLTVVGRTSGGTGTSSGVDTKVLTSTLARFSTVHLVAGASTAFVHSGINIIYTAGPVDVTIRIYAPQLETGRSSSTFIPTNGSAATRAADILTIPTGTWLSGTSGTLALEGDVFFTTNALNPGTVAIDDGTSGNSIFLSIDNTAKHNITIFGPPAGAKYFEYLSSASYIPQAIFRHAVSYETNNAIAASDGTLSSLDTAVTLPSNLTTLRLGDRRGAGARMNGHIRKFRYYPRRVSDATVQQLTQ